MLEETIDKQLHIFKPNEREHKTRTRLYKNIEEMRQLKSQPQPHFNSPDGMRSFNGYIDGSEKILNGFTLSREAQSKEAWQSNLLDNISRAKLRAIAAGVGLRVPDMEFTAVNNNGMRSSARAEVNKNIIKQTYEEDNPILSNFLRVWRMLSHGVIFEYEGYKTGGAMQPVVDSFDSRTGEVKTHMEYRKQDGKPFNVLINPQEFYWRTFLVNDVQDQPRVAWVQHYTKREVDLEFSKYKNHKFVMDKSKVKQFSQLQTSTYFNKWQENVNDENDYEVIRQYSKEDDGSDVYYGLEVWVNGIPMIQSPLLWGGKDKKYPFVKQISEPFANSNFFVGMSLAGILEAYQDGKNTVLNSLIDKLYRQINPTKLVGLQNRDLLDVEASIYTQDDTIYVPDINAVQFLEHPQINAGELAMLGILDKGLDLQSIPVEQQGQPGEKKTARQAVIEDVRAQEIKSILFLFLEDLWLQKLKLRNEIVLTHYIKDKAAQDTVNGQIITIKDYSFGDGGRGILDIHIAKTKGKLMSLQEIEAREQAMEKQGLAYKLISISSTYLDDWIYDYKIITQSFHKKDQLAQEDEFMGEIQVVTTLFPEFFVANKEKYLKDFLEIKGKHLDEFAPPAQPQAPPVEEGGEEQPQPVQEAPVQEEASLLGLQ